MFVPYWALPSGPERQRAKAEQDLILVATLEHGVKQFRDGLGRDLLIGPSGIRHVFDPDNEAERRAAMLGARSKLAPLPDAIGCKIVPPGILVLTAADEDFWILSSTVASYVNARNQASNLLRARDLPARRNSDLAAQLEKHDDKPNSAASQPGRLTPELQPAGEHSPRPGPRPPDCGAANEAARPA